ncbi:MAG TPA: TetR/AcrR family transcriptional regulator [Acidimicrobiia bacterium]|nr:TetR/AcrR family transcriptional regulator [Acidimicrobiia bacterium]
MTGRTRAWGLAAVLAAAVLAASVLAAAVLAAAVLAASVLAASVLAAAVLAAAVVAADGGTDAVREPSATFLLLPILVIRNLGFSHWSAMSETKPGRKGEILDAGATLFCQRGYQGTRMEDVAAAVELSKEALADYYPSTADILYHICLETADELLEGIRQRPSEAPPDKLLSLVVHDITAVIARHPDHVSAYFGEMPRLERWLTEEQHQAVAERQEELVVHVSRIVHAGTQAGVFRAVDARTGALGILGLAVWTHQWFTPDGDQTIDDVAEVLAEMAVASLSPATPSLRRSGGRRDRRRP